MHNHAYLQIDGITLLSIEEARELPGAIRDCGISWWLRSSQHDSNYNDFVVHVGSGYDFGFNTSYDFDMVRPALIIPELEDLDLEKYKDSVEIFGLEWIYIGNGMVLAEKPIFESIFDEESTNYETSEIKQKLENWLENQLNNQ